MSEFINSTPKGDKAVFVMMCLQYMKTVKFPDTMNADKYAFFLYYSGVSMEAAKELISNVVFNSFGHD